jgi:hypothetical protein
LLRHFAVSSVRVTTGASADRQVGAAGTPPETTAAHRTLHRKGATDIYDLPFLLLLIEGPWSSDLRVIAKKHPATTLFFSMLVMAALGQNVRKSKCPEPSVRFGL